MLVLHFDLDNILDRQKYRQKDRPMDRQTDGQKDWLVDGQADSRSEETDGRMDEPAGGWAVRWMEGRTHGRTDRQIYHGLIRLLATIWIGNAVHYAYNRKEVHVALDWERYWRMPMLEVMMINHPLLKHHIQAIIAIAISVSFRELTVRMEIYESSDSACHAFMLKEFNKALILFLRVIHYSSFSQAGQKKQHHLKSIKF